MAAVTGAAISLFSGAGGLDLGVEHAGFQTVAAVEWDEDAADSMEKNRRPTSPSCARCSAPTSTRSPRESRRASPPETSSARWSQGRERPDLLIGGPPAWPSRSPASGSTGSATASTRLPVCCRRTRDAGGGEPRHFILENVYALRSTTEPAGPPSSGCSGRSTRPATGPLAGAERGGLRRAAGSATAVHRRRTQARQAPRASGADSRRTVGAPSDGRTASACHNRGRRSQGLITDAGARRGGPWPVGHLLPEIPPGENYLHFTAERGHPDPLFEWRRRYWSFLLKLDPNRPSPTIQAQPGPNVGPFHWENRRLRVPEPPTAVHVPRRLRLRGQAHLGASPDRQLRPPLLAQTGCSTVCRDYRVLRKLDRRDPRGILGPEASCRPTGSPLLDWLRDQTAVWTPSIVGVFREHAPHDWPLTAHFPKRPPLSQLTDTATYCPSRASPLPWRTSWRSSFDSISAEAVASSRHCRDH